MTGLAIHNHEVHTFNGKYLRQVEDNIKVLIVDDHPIIGMAMELLVSSNFQKQKPSIDIVERGKDALQMLKNNKYDLILLDVHLPDYNVFSLIPNIFMMDEKARILVFTSVPESALARRLFSLKVSGFLSKKVSDEEIVEAIRVILKGGKYVSKAFSGEVVRSFMEGDNSSNPLDTLSDREYQVLMEILKGDTAKVIADRLHISHSSISTYRQRVFEKLGVSNQVELIKKAQIYGIDI